MRRSRRCSFRCRRRTIIDAPVCCLSTRTRLISPDQHLLKAPRHAALRQVLHLLHTTMSNCRSRDQALPTLRRRPRRPQSRLLRTAACPDGLVSYIYVWDRRSFSFACILRASTNHNTCPPFAPFAAPPHRIMMWAATYPHPIHHPTSPTHFLLS